MSTSTLRGTIRGALLTVNWPDLIIAVDHLGGTAAILNAFTGLRYNLLPG